MADPGIRALEHYARRIAEIERWLRRRGRAAWTATDWELAGALRLLAQALVAEAADPAPRPAERRPR